MAAKILVIHGPNLNLLGERPGDERGLTLDGLNHRIQQRASELGLEVKIFQSNHEGELVDVLHRERRWADAIIINPEALTHTSYVLREALAAVAKPTLEVHLADIRRRESWRRKSVIKDVCDAQVMGKGGESYLIALGRLASGDLAGRKRATRAAEKKTIGPAAEKAKTVGPAVEKAKTIGPAVEKSAPTEVAAALARSASGSLEKSIGRREPAGAKGGGRPAGETAIEFLSRALVRQKIADRLAGQLSTAALASWARAHYEQVRRGGAAETGHRELLEEALQALTLAAFPASKLSDHDLIELMTQLEG